MRTKTVRIDKTKHKTQPFTVTELGRVDKVRAERYKTERTASIGAVRACRDWLKANRGQRVLIRLPENRQRFGWFWDVDGSMMLSNITGTGKRKSPAKKKAVKSTTKKKK